MIKELTNLSPAEVLLIEDPDVKVHTLARVTFFDLILKEVLKIETDAKATEEEMKNPTVSIGKSYANYQPLKHESIFLSVFTKDDTLKIKLSNLLKAAFEKVKNGEAYKLKYVYTKERMNEHFNSNFFQRLLGIRVISENGLRVQKEIQRELKRIKINATRKTKNAVELLLAINGNIVLISKIPVEIFETIEKKKLSFRNENTALIWADYSYSNLYQQNTTKPQFDLIAINDSDFLPIIESIQGFNDSSGDSGCGSDGGCSACGGCGGCGG
ncbi:MAG: hypothetical protein AB8B65_06590 [Kordia sp.]|uniref:hypothetical protein n=1 Tax=Kordia sp. TaxID=1965332 RepID=UPI0038583CDA